jgi:hypothetical protein
MTSIPSPVILMEIERKDAPVSHPVSSIFHSSDFVDEQVRIHWALTYVKGECMGNLTDLRRILHLSLAKGNPK